MFPIMGYGWVFGPGPGIAAGLVYGVLQFIQEPYILNPAQFMMDFVFPFAALGLTGFFRRNLWAGAAVAGATRFCFHFLSGIIFWSSYAPEGQPAALYSLIYNGSYMLPEILICLVVASIPAVRKAFAATRGPAPKKTGAA
jgi:thiamine transporter